MENSKKNYPFSPPLAEFFRANHLRISYSHKKCLHFSVYQVKKTFLLKKITRSKNPSHFIKMKEKILHVVCIFNPPNKSWKVTCFPYQNELQFSVFYIRCKEDEGFILLREQIFILTIFERKTRELNIKFFKWG